MVASGPSTRSNEQAMNTTVPLIFAAGVLALAGCSTSRPASRPESKTAASVNDKIPASPEAGELLDRMVGKWVLTGTIGGEETTHDVDAEWLLNREYLRLHEVSRARDSKGAPAYEAIVLISWDQRSGEYSCLWLDSTAGGGLRADTIARGKPGGDSIPFLFKLGGGSFIHTTFVYARSSGTWQWNIDVEEGGKLQPFARVKLTKSPL
jgi:hypothetical protein